MKLNAVSVVVAIAICAPAATVCAETIGSPLQSRQFTDIDQGQVYIYAGTTSPFTTSGSLSKWSFFDDKNTGLTVTPLLLQISGGTYTVTAIGTSDVSAGTGTQTFSFGIIAGSATVTPGNFTFGFTNRSYSLVNSSLTAGASNTGVISFDRPSASIPNDPWLVTAGVTSGGPVTIQIGTTFGAGGVPIYNSIDPGGPNRVYSAQATVPEPTTIFLIAAGAIPLLTVKRRRSFGQF